MIIFFAANFSAFAVEKSALILLILVMKYSVMQAIRVSLPMDTAEKLFIRSLSFLLQNRIPLPQTAVLLVCQSSTKKPFVPFI